MAQAGLAPDKKGARRRGAAVAFLDETGSTFRARVGTTWAPTGAAPVLKRVERHRKDVSSMVALTAPLSADERPRLYARHVEGSVHAREVVQMLGYLHRKVGRPLIVVLDRLNAHRSREVADFIARHPGDYRLELLPPYAPDLNPEEQCNAAVKKAMLNALPTTVEEMRGTVRREFRRLQHRPRTLHAFFRHAGLALYRPT